MDITERKPAEAAEREQWMLAETLRETASELSRSLKLDEVLTRTLEGVHRPRSVCNFARALTPSPFSI
jgi:hypothetical protein